MREIIHGGMPSPVPIRIHPVLFWQSMLVYTYLHRTRMLRYKLKFSFKCLNTGKGGLLDNAGGSVPLRMNEWPNLTLAIIRHLVKFVSPERKYTYVYIWTHIYALIYAYKYS